MTKSEYDQCNLAVLHLAPGWVENMKSRINDIALVAKDSSFYSLVYWEAPDGYFVLPDDVMFRLDENEFESLISQFATSKRGGRRKLPYVFSEHGVLMLSSVLNSKQAIAVNIQIMRIFTKVLAKLFI